MKPRDLYANGCRIHEDWRAGSNFFLRLLGAYDPNMSRSVIDMRLSNDALTEDQLQEFWRGWESVGA